MKTFLTAGRQNARDLYKAAKNPRVLQQRRIGGVMAVALKTWSVSYLRGSRDHLTGKKEWVSERGVWAGTGQEIIFGTLDGSP